MDREDVVIVIMASASLLFIAWFTLKLVLV